MHRLCTDFMHVYFMHALHVPIPCIRTGIPAVLSQVQNTMHKPCTNFMHVHFMHGVNVRTSGIREGMHGITEQPKCARCITSAKFRHVMCTCNVYSRGRNVRHKYCTNFARTSASQCTNVMYQYRVNSKGRKVMHPRRL